MFDMKKQLIPRYAYLPIVVCIVWNTFVYNMTRFFTNKMTHYDFSIKLDRETTINTVGFVPKFKPPVIVNMMLEAVEDIDNNAIILRFNPWLCSDPKQLITQFFKQMATAIKLKKPKAEKRR